MRHLGRSLAMLLFAVTACTADNTPTPTGDAGTDAGPTDSGMPGIAVSKASGNTTEAGGKATFTVKLDSKPTSSVTVHFDSNKQSEGKVDKTSLMFTTDNWAAAQTVTVTGQDDMIADGDQSYAVVFTATTSDDTSYAAITPDSVKLTNVDNDTAGITVSKISGKTGEDGTSATFTVVLNTQPGADVTVHFDSDNSDEGTVNPTSLTFTMDNWNAPQTATVTGVDDNVADGDQTYHITFGATTSMDARYAGMTPDELAVVNTDNDSAGFTVSMASGDTTEAGGTATFTIKLNTQPTADVTVHFDSNDKGEGTVDNTSLTFTKDNWNSTQTVTVTGVDDSIADGNQSYSVTFGDTTSDDEGYAAIKPGDVHFTNTDNDSAGVTVGSISGDTSENGTTATFTVVLNSQPSANVTVGLTSSKTSEGTVSPAMLTFTSDNWNSAQTVTVTGVDDSVQDGDQQYAIQFAATVSDDDAYNGLTISDVAVTNLDDDTNGITVSAISGDTNESGTQAHFTVRLRAQPSDNVVVHFMSSDTTEGTTDKTSLTFTTVNWNAPQTVTVTGVDDNLDDGTQVYSITFSATTGAAGYAGLTPSAVTVRNIDNDTAGVTVSAISGNTGEDGTQAHFTVVLNAQPGADVNVHFDTNNVHEGVPNRTTLTFTSANWNAPQTVNVTGVDDMVADGPQMYAIVFTVNTSSDANYAAITPSRVNITNIDNDSAAVIVSSASGATRENGTQATFTVVLTSQPTANVVLNLHSDDTTEGTVSPAVLTFTTANYHAPQTVTVTGVQDSLADGDQVYHVVFDRASSSDTNYGAITPSSVSLTNIDDDSPGITVSAISRDTDETGRTATFTVQLNSQPFSPVTVNFASSNVQEGVTNVPSLTFTAANWNAPQTVTVTGVDDSIQDGNQPYLIMFSATTSSDATYAAITPGNVDVINDDNDSAGINVSAINGNTRENGTQATFSVVLTSQPTDDVTLHFATNNAAEGTTGVTSLLFTMANWNAAQTVIVTGQDDDVQDGDQPYSIVFTATTSNDPNYDQLTPSSVSVINVDNDTAGITVSLASGNTTEGGGQAHFTVVLNSRPTDNVTVHFASNDTSEGTTDSTSLLFTPASWNSVQTVTLTGQNDDIADGTQPYSVVFAATTSTDALYNGLRPTNVLVFNTDNDTAGITVSAISRDTNEGGQQATFTVVLNSQPMADVTVHFASDTPTEGLTNLTSLTFTSVDWNAAQIVTVTGQQDSFADGNQTYYIDFTSTTSSDPAYAAITPQRVTVVNDDDDTAGFVIGAISGNTTEAGGTATFTIKLSSQPTGTVIVNYMSTNTAEGVTMATSKTFDNTNWNINQTVTVTGINDFIQDGDQGYFIHFSATTGTDTQYAMVALPLDVAVTNTDDDTAGFTLGLVSGDTTELHGTATFTVVLNSQPTANVTVNYHSDNTNEGTLSPASLMFDANNWNVPQTITATGVDDSIADGNQTYHVVFDATTTTAPHYMVIKPANVTLVNDDNEIPGILVSAISGHTSEAGGTATFTVVLTVAPSADVTVHFATDAITEGTADSASLTFTTSNWNMPQTVTVTGVDDLIADGPVTYHIVFTGSTSTDVPYQNLIPTQVTVINDDNETASLTVGAISGHTSEAGVTATFTVALAVAPTADVTVSYSSDNMNEGTVSGSPLTFTTSNWNMAQTVTVTGVDDMVADGPISYHINLSTTSTDAPYNGLTPTPVAVINDDNEMPAINLGAISNHTSEAGGTAMFTVVLSVAPTADVTVSYSSDNVNEGTVSGSPLTFTTSNWNMAQTVMVTGVDDMVADGAITYHINVSSTSADAPYNGLTPTPVAVINDDDETASVMVSMISGHTSEGGTTATFTVVLSVAPTADVNVGYSSDNINEGTVSGSPLVFTTGNWNMAQTVTVTGADDSIADGPTTYHIDLSTTSADAPYNGLTPSQVTVINDDNDDPCAAYGNTADTIVANHVVVCNASVMYGGWDNAMLTGGWTACTDTQFPTLAGGATTPGYFIWLERPNGICGGGFHELVDPSCTANDPSCYDDALSCDNDSNSYPFAVCK